MGQAPVVFLRQVLGLVVNPDGMNDPSIPDDAKERAKAILDGCKVSIVLILMNLLAKFDKKGSSPQMQFYYINKCRVKVPDHTVILLELK